MFSDGLFLPAHQIKRHHACIYAVQYLFYIVSGGKLRFPNLYLRGDLDGQIVSALEVFADQVQQEAEIFPAVRTV